jgi:hypothetical protein
LKKLLARLVRQSPAMIVAMLALFVALTGTAVATTSALITGKQIANSSITGLDVKNKSLTPKDFKGSVRGARGPAGAAGAAGVAGSPGAKGDKGDKGDPGPFPQGNLPSGTTIRGNYGTGGAATTSTKFYFVDIAYNFQMSAPLTSNWLATGDPPTAACPGSNANPQAAPGNLCLYENASNNVASREPFQSSSTRWGASPFLRSGIGGADGVAWSHGTWAATAP